MKILSRTQMKNLMGGQMPGGGGGIGDVGEGDCIWCSGGGGPCGDGVFSCWYSNNPDPSAFCKTVYSGCPDAGGSRGSCASSCVMN